MKHLMPLPGPQEMDLRRTSVQLPTMDTQSPPERYKKLSHIYEQPV